jgi:signal transduction histidine kinase
MAIQSNSFDQKNKILEAQNSEILRQSHELLLQQKKTEEYAAYKSKINFLLSHDIRFSLVTIGNVLEGYSMGRVKAEVFNELAPILSKEMKMLNELYTEVLEWTKAETIEENFTTKRSVFSPFFICSEIVSAYTNSLSEKKLIVSNLLNEEKLITFNENVFKLIIRNLLANAIKYSRPNGCIEIVFEQRRAKYFIGIKDNGVGISPEKLAHIRNGTFILSVKEHSEMGTGLGLFFCKEFLEKAGSRLIIESIEGQGSLFGFEI